MGCRRTGDGVLLACLAFLVFVLEIQGCCSLNHEGTALLQFRARVNDDPFRALANWDPNDCDPCLWSGIECLDGKVHMLDLSGLDLEGALGPELGNLTHLRFLDLSHNRFLGNIPPEFAQITSLEVLDLRDNNLTGPVPPEFGGLTSLKLLLLCNNSLEGDIPVEIEKLGVVIDFRVDEILPGEPSGAGCMNRKFGHCIWQNVLTQWKNPDLFRRPIEGALTRFLNIFPLFKIGAGVLHADADNSCTNVTDSPEEVYIGTVDRHVNNVRRMLVEHTSNLEATPPTNWSPSPSISPNALPSRSSGSFPAVPNWKEPVSAPAPSPTPPDHSTTNTGAISRTTDKQSSTNENSEHSVKIAVIISAAVFSAVLAIILLLIFKRRMARNIVPWKKSELSGQLQNALVTGIPKLNRDELESACEDFSNIIGIYEGVATMYKGTLSSGVEIVVASTVISSLKQWSKRSEMAYRKKIDGLSRVNHKNFVNLIGYCEEDEPFTRMMVFEYAPNGNLFEHLHVEESEFIDWRQRMRIIMGIAYCLQHMHDLNPPVEHVNLNSKDILLTDDYAAKIADVAFWAELVAKSKNRRESDSEHSVLPPSADMETNIHSFGVLLLEIITGRPTFTEEHGCLVDWAAQYLNDRRTISRLVDPALKSFKDNELERVCEVIQCCIQQDPVKRPAMKDVIEILREAIDISPEAAVPRLSPLWWAELEILSTEAA